MDKFLIKSPVQLKQIIDQIQWFHQPLYHHSLAQFTSFKSGGLAWAIIKCSTIDELKQILQLSKQYQFPYLIIGKGSNTLFTDEGFHGVIIQLVDQFKAMHVAEDTLIAYAGVHNRQVFMLAAKHELAGAEFLSTIPGTIGGSLFMNAGAYSQEMKNITKKISIINQVGQIETYDEHQFQFEYRKSIFMQNKETIISCVLQLQRSQREKILLLEKEYITKRKASQPINRLTWGSVFKNPQNQKAAVLIEKCELKGQGYGAAKVSQLHANFIENHGQATFDDIEKTIKMIIQTVKKKFKIELQLEVRIYDCYGTLLRLN